MKKQIISNNDQVLRFCLAASVEISILTFYD